MKTITKKKTNNKNFKIREKLRKVSDIGMTGRAMFIRRGKRCGRVGVWAWERRPPVTTSARCEVWVKYATRAPSQGHQSVSKVLQISRWKCRDGVVNIYLHAQIILVAATDIYNKKTKKKHKKTIKKQQHRKKTEKENGEKTAKSPGIARGFAARVNKGQNELDDQLGPHTWNP